MEKILLLGFATCIISAALTGLYYKIALRIGPVALPNHRSLHQHPVPRGGGLAIAVAALLFYAGMVGAGLLDRGQMMVYLLGGVIFAVLGAADDRLDLPPKLRLSAQMLMVLWMFYWLKGSDVGAWPSGSAVWGGVWHGMLLLVFIWLFSAYNFVDGTDGMAATAAIFIAGVMAAVLACAGIADGSWLLVGLAAACAGFLFFNLPPARLFMGDAGSSFIGYILVAAMIDSCHQNADLVWPWVIAAGFYLCDTTITTTTRALRTPRFWEGHRSHAYQNLARIWNSHARVLSLAMAINLLWLLPAVGASVALPEYGPWIAAAALLPLGIFSLKFGPLYQDK